MPPTDDVAFEEYKHLDRQCSGRYSGPCVINLNISDVEKRFPNEMRRVRKFEYYCARTIV